MTDGRRFLIALARRPQYGSDLSEGWMKFIVVLAVVALGVLMFLDNTIPDMIVRWVL